MGDKPDPLFMTIPEAAAYLRLNEYRIRCMIEAKEIKSIKIGRLHRVSVSDLQRWAVEEVERQNEQAPGQQRGEHLQAG